MKILFFGDGSWAAESLLRLRAAGMNLLGVVLRTRPSDGSLEEAARRLELPLFQPQRVNDPAFLAQIAELGPDLNLSVSYDQILRAPILASAPLGFVNFHAGKLPYYRGRSVLNWALINGETEIGYTGHYVDEGIDTGDIILQRTMPVGWTESYGDVMARMIAAFPALVLDTVQILASGSAHRQPQSHLPGSYFPARGPGDEWLDWSDTSRNLHNKIRGISRPGPGARTLLEGRPVTLWRAYYDPAWPSYLATPGQVVGRKPGEGVVVKTGDSTLLVLEAQEEGEPPAAPTWRIGTRLGLNLMEYVRSLEARLAEAERRGRHPG